MKMDKNKLSNERSKKDQKDLFGLDPDESLISVNFATTENHYLNEQGQLDSPDQQ
ncbi:hypothetical protein [Alkalihalobacillus deserti]|uniref:hypothetical protein n=1 Tax=Alkalihalobacillus deserti TaxID=2879466 RepID=UPI001D1498F9|nr:hypothetical protein [Alkalihalobacillus deserti]